MKEIPTYPTATLANIVSEYGISKVSEIASRVRDEKNLYNQIDYIEALRIIAKRVLFLSQDLSQNINIINNMSGLF